MYSFSINIKNLILTFLLIIVTICQQPTQPSFINYCQSYQNKKQFQNKALTYHQNTAIQKSIASMFPANKQIMVPGIFSSNSSAIMQSVSGYVGIYILNLVIFGIFGVLLVLFVPILLCTNCCACCCTKLKDGNYVYTPCQMCWPGTCIFVLLVALIAIAAVNIKIGHDFQPKTQDFKCSLGVMTNDIIQGGTYYQNQNQNPNKNKSQIKFMGLNYYLGRTQKFLNQMNIVNLTLNKDLITNSATIKNISKQLNILPTLIQKIPNQDGQQLTLQYPNPLLSNNSNNVQIQNSTFPQILGTIQIPYSIIFNLSLSVFQINKTLEYITQQSDVLSSVISPIPSQKIKKSTKQQVKKFQKFQFQVQNSIGIAQTGLLKIYYIIIYIVLGFTIFVATFQCLFLFCMACCTEYECISKFTCCCGMLWFIGLAWFALGMIFGLANPVVYHGCEYFREGFKSSQNYQKYIQKVIKVDNQTNDLIKNCLSSSNNPYYFYDNIIPIQLRSNLTNLSLASASYPLDLSIQNLSQDLSLTYNKSLSTIQKYRTARILDIQNPSMIQQLKKVAKTEPCFLDTWIPSIYQQPQIITCGNVKQKADNNTCKNKIGFQQRLPGCNGCMDTYTILEGFFNADSLKQALQIRYAGCLANGRKQLINNLVTLWQNYYLPKKQIITNIKNHTDQIQTYINKTTHYLSNQISPSYNTTINWLLSQPLLQSSHNNSNNNQTLNKNMDCRVLGKAIDNSVKIFCNSTIQYVYVLRFMYYAGALLIFFICCFSVCMMTRIKHQRQISRINREFKDKKQKINQQINNDNKATTQRLALNQIDPQIDNHPYFNTYK